ncbi:MAG: threonine/serine dehydratase [Nitriliruptoraceae bacterium]
MIELDDVRAAARRLAAVAHRTPVFTSATLDQLTQCRVFLKAESMQRTGSFKFRGAYNRLARLTVEERRRGVLAYSSGNHAQAVALAAKLLEIPATIVMPADAPSIKLDATRGYGAEVVFYDRYRQDRLAVATELARQRNLVVVPPYDDPDIMAGQGTAALELMEDVDGLDMLVVCIGGGGLMAGSSTAVKGVDPSITVVGVEPAARDITRRSVEIGIRIAVDVPATIADGLQTTQPGELTFEVNRRHVDTFTVATDAQMIAAMLLLFTRLKLVIEPSGACALAAVIAGNVACAGKRVGVILSGGNIAPDRFAHFVTAAQAPTG